VASAAEPIIEVAVREGDAVTRGQVLVRLDPRRHSARVEAAEARAARAEARLAELERGGREERREQARADVAAARSELEQALLDRARAAALVEEGVQPQAELDVTTTRVETAEARLRRERAALDEMVSGATTEELRQARSELDAAVAELADLEVELERLTVRAPVDARVDALPFEVGEAPGVGATLVVLLSSGPPYARIYVPEPELARATVGTPARVEADATTRAGERESLEGRVRFVSREATFTPHYALSERDRHRLAFVAEVEITGPSVEAARDLPAGLPVRVELLREEPAASRPP
jgi:HlyD family secretion protein